MTTKQILTAVMAGVVGWNTGCVTYEHSGFDTSLLACGGPAGIPAPVRQRVYLFLMNGADPVDSAALCKLRDKVCEAGFSKVYLAQRMDANWYEREVRRVALEDPSARVVLLGVGVAADKILPLAASVVEDGVNVDAVLLLNPTGDCEPAPAPQYPVIVLRSEFWARGANRPENATENRVVPKAWHLSVANSPVVVEAVVKQMVASAEKVGALPSDPLPRTALSDIPNPTPRGIDPATLGDPNGEWNFLLTPPSLIPLVVPEPVPATSPMSQEAATAHAGEKLPPPRAVEVKSKD